MTLIADMVERMLAANAPAASIVDAVRTAETVTSRERDASRSVTVPNRSPAAIRAARYRENLKQKQGEAKANDVASTGAQPHDDRRDASRDGRDDAPTFLSSLSLNEEGASEQGSKKKQKARSENARARGQRMVAGAILTDEWRDAAIKLGAEPSQVPEMWAEHVDYWVAVPGERGVKTDWLATWRNDVRRKLKMGNRNGQRPRQQSLSDLAGDLAEQARSAERARGLI